MGTPVPPTYPDFVAGKWYRCHIDSFLQQIPPRKETCADPYFGSAKACILGSVIKAWLPHQCDLWWPLYLPLAGAQRLTACHGPYNTWEDCVASLSG